MEYDIINNGKGKEIFQTAKQGTFVDAGAMINYLRTAQDKLISPEYKEAKRQELMGEKDDLMDDTPAQ